MSDNQIELGLRLSRLTLITITASLNARRALLVQRIENDSRPHCRKKNQRVIAFDRNEIARIDNALAELPSVVIEWARKA